MVAATINYLSPDSRINRFFWAPEGRLSTSISLPYEVEIGDARIAGQKLTLDAHGFTLVDRPTAVAGLDDRGALDTVYAAEVISIARELTGADLVVPMGYELRSSDAEKSMLPPAARAHIDYDTRTAHQIAQRRYRKAEPYGLGYDRFILFSLWRCFSPPPQDWPLALCDFESSKDTAEIRCVKIDVPRLPEGDALHAPVAGEDQMGASALFMFDPRHRWWWYPAMTRDEAILIKFHDSDHGRAWRTPHCAFHDETTAKTVPRESIEFRGCAYFTKR
ncbi:MAG TPA: CmcJ/NvfI family oxidoreductase [Sphingobium sp.]